MYSVIKGFKTQSLIKIHIENVHEASRIHECAFCEVKGKRRQHLEDHLKTHPEQCISCDKCECDYKTKIRSDFVMHKCSPKPFSCNFYGMKKTF